MKKLNLFLSIVAFFGMVNMSSAQMSKGHITQEITAVSADDEQMAMAAEMMKGTQTEIYFNEANNLVQMSMMGGMVETKTLVDTKTESINLFFDAMGQKMLVQSTKEEMEKVGGDQVDMMKSMKVTYDEADTKEILGYKCIKANVSSAEEKGMSFSMYVAPDVKADHRLIQNMQYLELKGFPLEYTADMGMMKMTITTVKIEDAVDDSVFTISDSGYKKMTFDEFMEAMGGMGGMGF